MKLKTMTLETNSDIQKKTEERLCAILAKYPEIDKWTFTDSLVIEDEGVSFSHPVLTLGAKQLDSKKDDNEFLSIYIHENLHWFASQHPDNLQKAKQEMRLLFPKVKVGNEQGGARDEESTYLHLIICYLEYLALSELVGKEIATNVISNHLFYRWIYKTVLEQTELLESIILEKCNLNPRINLALGLRFLE